MKIEKGIDIRDLSLYLTSSKTLIISDVHLGYEQSLSDSGVFLPRFQYKETIERLDKIFENLKVNKIIINGDLKHEFGRISNTEWKTILNLVDYFLDKCKDVVFIRGNHDKILEPVLRKKNFEIRDYFLIDNLFICHGDKVFDNEEFKKSKILVIGSAVSLEKDGRKEKYKCFLIGKWKNKKLIVMPSFNLVIEGTDILNEKLLSPFLHQNLDDFEVYVVGDKVYHFGKIVNFK